MKPFYSVTVTLLSISSISLYAHDSFDGDHINYLIHFDDIRYYFFGENMSGSFI